MKTVRCYRIGRISRSPLKELCFSTTNRSPSRMDNINKGAIRDRHSVPNMIDPLAILLSGLGGWEGGHAALPWLYGWTSCLPSR